MKKLISVLALIVTLCTMCGAVAGKGEKAEILAVFSCPKAQIITEADQSKDLADTVIFLYHDFTYIQYVNHDNRYEIYSSGTFEVDFDWNEPGWQYDSPHILTVHAQQFHVADHALETADLTYDINLDRVADYCLYPNNVRPDLKLTAAFMQVNKQKLVKADGSEEYLPTIWFYYQDGSFEQHAIIDGQGDVVFSCGDYSITDPGFTEKAVLTIHRTMKYQDGIGLAEYDSTHDYVIGELDFIRIWPNE
jgi:hypothetical protein